MLGRWDDDDDDDDDDGDQCQLLISTVTFPQPLNQRTNRLIPQIFGQRH